MQHIACLHVTLSVMASSTHTKKWLRWLRISAKTLFGVYLFLVVGLLVADRFVQFRESDEEIVSFYEAQNLPIHIDTYPCLDRTIRYVYTESNTAKPTILFIHGAPSSSSYYRNFLSDSTLRAKANLIAVDRPGYGYSGFGNPVPELSRQAYMIRPILDSLHKYNHPVLVVGASYGTSIAARLAMDYPNLVDGLLLLAPSLAPGEEKTYDVSYVLESPFFSWAQPRMIHSANVEKFAHTSELTKMLPLWAKIKQPVQYFQGQNDDLIYTTNAGFAKKNLVNTLSLKIQMLPNRGHLIVYDEHVRIRAAIDDMIHQSAAFYAEKTMTLPQAWQASVTAAHVASDQ